MRRYKIKKANMEIDLAPLIDVVFLLLIFFMVASTLDANEIRATIQLPQVSMCTEVEKSALTLYLNKSGEINIDHRFVSWGRLRDYLKGKEDEEPQEIEVYADKEVDFEYIVKIMDIATQLKREKISFYLKSIQAD